MAVYKCSFQLTSNIHNQLGPSQIFSKKSKWSWILLFLESHLLIQEMVRIYPSFQDFTLIISIDCHKFFCLRLWLPPCDSWWVQYIKIFIISTRGRNHDDLGLSSSPSPCPCHPQPYFDRHPGQKVRLKEGKTAKITDIPGFLTQCIQSKVAATKIIIAPKMFNCSGASKPEHVDAHLHRRDPLQLLPWWPWGQVIIRLWEWHFCWWWWLLTTTKYKTIEDESINLHIWIIKVRASILNYLWIFEQLGIIKGGKSCTGARVAPAEKFGLGRKF